MKLYRPRNGRKELTGTLTGYDGGDVTLTIGGETVTLPKEEIALVRLYVEF